MKKKKNKTPQQIYEALVQYLHAMVARCDWHAVSDVANDIRNLLEKYPKIKEEKV